MMAPFAHQTRLFLPGVSACVTTTGATGGGPSECVANRVGLRNGYLPIVAFVENLI
jgi:hypothetical protein